MKDMPEGVLDGRLGDICARRMALFPRAYAWPALLTAASVLTPRSNGTKYNLFTALVGPVESGKSCAIEWAQGVLGLHEPELLTSMAGSAEALIKRTLNCLGNPRLLSPDELAHLFNKAQIQNSSFFPLLCRAFYHDKFDLILGKGSLAPYWASLSILGGIVDTKFEDLFSSNSTAGMYSRFLFGEAPSDAQFDYMGPFYGQKEKLIPFAVTIADDVWIEMQQWFHDDPEIRQQKRTAEIAVRGAAICASLDGRPILKAADLGPALQLTRYQIRIRRMRKPNPGETFEGKVSFKILAVLNEHNGKFIPKRQLMREINYHRYGPSIVQNAYSRLLAEEEIFETKIGKEKLVRCRTLEDALDSPEEVK